MKAFRCPVCQKDFELKNWVYNNRRKKNPEGVICCSHSCAQKLKIGDKTPNWKGGMYEDQYTRYRKYSPEKYKAQNTVQRALRKGVIQKQNCQKCKEVKTEAHHPNYFKPLDIIWLCHKCHMEEHYAGI